MTVREQVVVLVALTNGVFDTVALERMPAAEQAVREASTRLPTEIEQRIFSGEELWQNDRAAIVDLSKNAVESILQVT
jgi:F-type H+-transporting ATPase subunit alpha